MKKYELQSQPSFQSLLPTATKDIFIFSLNFCVYFEKFNSKVLFWPIFNWVTKIYLFLFIVMNVLLHTNLLKQESLAHTFFSF